MKDTKKVLYFIWQKLNNYKMHLIASFILFGAMIFLSVVLIPIYIKRLTDVMAAGDFSAAYHTTFIILLIFFVSRLGLFVSMHILAWFESRLGRDLDEFSYENFTKHSYNFYTNQFTGSLVDKSQRLGRNMISIIDGIMFNFYALFISVIGVFWVLLKENSIIALIFFCFLVLFLGLTFWMGKKMSPIYKDRSISKSNFSGAISDIIMNIQTVLFFENKSIDKEIFMKANENFHEKRYRAWRIAINYQDIIGFLPSMFTAGITIYAVFLAAHGSISTGSVILIFLLSNNLRSLFWRLGGSAKRFVSDMSDTAEAIEIIELVSEVKDINDFQEIKMNKGAVVFEEVIFTYPEGDHIFEKFNLSIPSGQSIGIVGKSGSGKTTITKLLLRLYDVDNGEIAIDNQNIADVKQSDLRNNIAYIPQETVLFHRSIYENIAYGDLNATHEQVMDAAVAAHVDEFVQNLAEKYKTKVGERGVKLSGGQRQRIGIARAMLRKNAPILMLDEATSSLDSMSEKYIQDSFEKLSKNRTTIVIAHRLSTIQKMDRIIVMEHGKIIEDGSHTELLSKKGHYAMLWNSQINGFIADDV